MRPRRGRLSGSARGAVACRAAGRTCRENADCCTRACGPKDSAERRTCQGACPAGAGGLCGNPKPCGCGSCLARREGGVACGYTVKPSDIPCNECLTDADCASLYPSEPAVVCADPGPECNCEGVTPNPGVCVRPCGG
jgi:hypothetical protein